jgi:hypothetical protein
VVGGIFGVGDGLKEKVQKMDGWKKQAPIF